MAGATLGDLDLTLGQLHDFSMSLNTIMSAMQKPTPESNKPHPEYDRSQKPPISTEHVCMTPLLRDLT